MATHQLYLDIPDTSNTKIFKVSDDSIYSNLIDVDCATLQIKVPGYTDVADISVTRGFSETLTACDLGIYEDCSDNSPVLPDGIYQVRYSVSPNDLVYVDYYHLRISRFMESYSKELCKLELATCEPSADIKSRLKELNLIKDFVMAAKAKVEVKHDKVKGMDLLTYAKKRLDLYKNNFC